jgi:hypothetical protein
MVCALVRLPSSRYGTCTGDEMSAVFGDYTTCNCTVCPGAYGEFDAAGGYALQCEPAAGVCINRDFSPASLGDDGIFGGGADVSGVIYLCHEDGEVFYTLPDQALFDDIVEYSRCWAPSVKFFGNAVPVTAHDMGKSELKNEVIWLALESLAPCVSERTLHTSVACLASW